MKVFQHEKPGTVVVADAGQLQLLITLMENKLLTDPERAARLAGPEVFAAFDNFSNGHIQEAINEAKTTGSRNIVISGHEGTKEKHEAEVAAAKAKADTAHKAYLATFPAKPATPPATWTPTPAPTPQPSDSVKPIVPPTTPPLTRFN